MQDQASRGRSERTFALSHLASDRRIAPMLVLGASAGIPFLLVYQTQSAWLYGKVPLGIIGLLSEMTLAYKFKFLWAPFLEHNDPPLLGRLIGRQRGWIVLSQIAVALSLAGIAFGDPEHWLSWTVAFSLALGFAGASQDVTIDGWRITSARDDREQALLLSWSETGYRVGNFVAGAGALYLASWFGWRAAYLWMAAAMLPGLIAALLAPTPEIDRTGRGPRPGFVATFVTPIRELITRLGPLALPILVMVAGFRMPGYLSAAMEVPLFKHLGYSNADIATVTKLFGFWIALGGTFLSAWVIPRIGMMASLIVGTVAGSSSHLFLAYLAAVGGSGTDEFWLFAVTVSLDSFAYAFAQVVLFTYMSTLAAPQHAASQFALLTSLCALPGSLLAGGSGFLIDRIGFPWFFVGTSLIGLPVALWCVHVRHLHGRLPATTAQQGAV